MVLLDAFEDTGAGVGRDVVGKCVVEAVIESCCLLFLSSVNGLCELY